ncbi:hypothetical protein NE237_032736 [Protea cynaroides]|uniref:Uncharacterized protein n=1 Tax=Protea cynaroides TaxID=273540 RepID=A0A9Q0R3N9_9MAGN|nr:hypothetical protein NE237_032736 [Protea cynaroides]
MASSLRVSILFTVLILFLVLSAFHGSSSSLGVGDGREISANSFRNLRGLKKNKRMIPDCAQKPTKSECLQGGSKCRWCQSDAIDDMCFTFSEAWRLPPQVFSCE